MTTFKKLAPISSISMYAIASDDTLYYFNGTTWVQKDTTPITDISVTLSGSLFGIITSTQLLSKWSGTNWGAAKGSQTLKAISAKDDNLVYAIASDDTTYYWNGAYWKQVDTDTVSSLAISKV